MIRHLIKLVWNRKRFNFLITVEFFFSFLTLFCVILAGVYFADNYRHPLGFNYENVWNVGIDMKQASDDFHSPEQVETTRQLYLTLREFDEIEMAAGVHIAPFGTGGIGNGTEINGRTIFFNANEVTDDFNKTMGLTLTQGRWFGKEDDGVSWNPVVVNQRLARELFGDEDPIGKNTSPNSDRETRVIGVVTDFRQWGEFSPPGNYLFRRKNLNDVNQRPPRNLAVKLRPGTPRAFEEKLVTRLQAVAKEWSFEVRPLAEMRDSSIKLTLAFLMAGALIVGFLMIMVALGLTGVLWQSVTQRTKEIGLRRAKGATARRIHRQILAELLLIATAGLGAGVAVIIQFPLLDLIGFISGEVYAMSIVISLAVIYALTIVCGLYPSWMATKVQPAEALHYE